MRRMARAVHKVRFRSARSVVGVGGAVVGDVADLDAIEVVVHLVRVVGRAGMLLLVARQDVAHRVVGEGDGARLAVLDVDREPPPAVVMVITSMT